MQHHLWEVLSDAQFQPKGVCHHQVTFAELSGSAFYEGASHQAWARHGPHALCPWREGSASQAWNQTLIDCGQRSAAPWSQILLSGVIYFEKGLFARPYARP